MSQFYILKVKITRMKFKYLTEQNNILKTNGTVAHYLNHLPLKIYNQTSNRYK